MITNGQERNNIGAVPIGTENKSHCDCNALIGCGRHEWLAVCGIHTFKELLQLGIVRDRKSHTPDGKLALGFKYPAFGGALNSVIGKACLDGFRLWKAFDLHVWR